MAKIFFTRVNFFRKILVSTLYPTCSKIKLEFGEDDHQMAKKDETDPYYHPGPHVHPKKYSSSGGLADWGPLLSWFSDGIKKLWHRFKK